jgi:hypothetical protein
LRQNIGRLKITEISEHRAEGCEEGYYRVRFEFVPYNSHSQTTKGDQQ